MNLLRVRGRKQGAAVVRNFAGVGETLRPIKNPAAVRISELLWERTANPEAPLPELSAEEVLEDLLDPIDVEDLVLLLPQSDGWLLLPSSRMLTPRCMSGRCATGKVLLAVVSVKSGASNPVPIPELAEEQARRSRSPTRHTACTGRRRTSTA